MARPMFKWHTVEGALTEKTRGCCQAGGELCVRQARPVFQVCQIHHLAVEAGAAGSVGPCPASKVTFRSDCCAPAAGFVASHP